MTRNETRENLMKILYELDASGSMDMQSASRLISERFPEEDKKNARRSADLIGKVINDLDDIDATINSKSTKWKTGRMPKVDLAIMRLAIGEYRFCADIPEAVTVNEAINLAKRYSTDHSSKFIHGVLGAVFNEK